MSESQLRDALNNCIDALADGRSLEDCVQDYPDLADELRPLLEIGQATSQNRANFSELQQMHSRLDADIEQLIENTEFRSRFPFQLPRGMTVLVASLVVTVIGLTLFLSTGDSNPVGNVPAATATATFTATPTTALTPEPEATDDVKAPDCEATPPDWFEYKVEEGDTLLRIAFLAETSTNSLRAANCLSRSAEVEAGQIIYVPRQWDDDNILPDDYPIYEDDD